jgi:hypothetical protein
MESIAMSGILLTLHPVGHMPRIGSSNDIPEENS